MIIMMIFNLSTPYFHKKIVSLVCGLFEDETDLRVRCVYFLVSKEHSPGSAL